MLFTCSQERFCAGFACRYRCNCASGFTGHDCLKPRTRAASTTRCHLSSGAKSAEGATGTTQSAGEFRKALLYFVDPVTHATPLLPAGVDFERFCVEMNSRLEEGGVCQQTFQLYFVGKKTAAATTVLDCRKKAELFVVLELCAEPCMSDTSNVCCFVPLEIAWMFPCCRQLKCCPDQRTGDRRRLARGSASVLPRDTPAVSVSVSVEEISASKTKF